MACYKELTDNMLFDCADSPIKGLDAGKAVLINVADIDLTATTTNGAIVTNLQLKSGKTGYSLEFKRDLANVAHAYAPNSEDLDGFTHSFIGRLMTQTAENAERLAELAGGRYVVVVETRYKGVDQEDAFKVYGLRTGMLLTENTGNTNENSGSMPITLATAEGDVEQYPYQVLLETDYAVSKASFDSLFAEA